MTVNVNEGKARAAKTSIGVGLFYVNPAFEAGTTKWGFQRGRASPLRFLNSGGVKSPPAKSLRFIIALVLFFVSTVIPVGHAASDWREEWEKALRAGKQEGKIVIYTFPGQELLFQEFQKTFPDIKLVEVTVRGSERVTRILAERRAEKYLADILIGGVGSAQSGLLKSGLLDPIKSTLILPEVTDASKWWGGKHIYGDDENKYIFAFAGTPLYYFHYNTSLVNPQEFKSYWDLLNPKWKGKIVVAEPMSGGTQEPLVFMYHSKELGPEFLRRLLSEMDVGVGRDTRQLMDWVAQGKYAMSALQNADRIRLWDAKKQGLPINAFETDKFKEGGLVGSGGGNIALIDRAPHPNAAKVFINWFLSREGQIAYQKLVQGGRNSLRIDIPKDDLPLHSRIKPGAKYTLVDDIGYSDLDSVRRFVTDIWKKK
jgi:iron(III) transport system substrate-binding protein